MEKYSFMGGPNREEMALFRAIQDSMVGSMAGKWEEIDAYLVHNLAACAVVSMRYDKAERIPWGDHDDVHLRMFNGFINTLGRAIKAGKVSERNGKTYLDAFHVPDWFIEEAKTWEGC